MEGGPGGGQAGPCHCAEEILWYVGEECMCCCSGHTVVRTLPLWHSSVPKVKGLRGEHITVGIPFSACGMSAPYLIW